MTFKIGSLIGFGIVVLGLLFLIDKNYILSKNPITIIIQICSIALMIWARITFGLRSFHATANTTKGELVTTGPYRWLRHPIYAAVIYFSSASIIAYPFIDTMVAVILISVGLFIRMILEEKSLLLTYDDYAEYSKRAKRIIPFVF
jgi:protein-S-isoprenylcysteine O-methyltransferase Ste14